MSEQTKWIVQVPVATLWTTPDSARVIDEPGLTNPLRLDEWYARMTYEPRLALCSNNLVQSQMLFGEEVIVDRIKGYWAEIVVPSQASKKDKRGYPGWVPIHQIAEVDEHWNASTVARVITPSAPLLNTEGEHLFDVSYLTLLSVTGKAEDYVQVRTPEDGPAYVQALHVEVFASLDAIPQGNGEDVVAAGMQFIDLPYFWGGMSSFGYDCSGFSYNMLKAAGYEIPRDASDQVLSGKEIPLDEVAPGDLIYFAYEEGKGSVHHVAIYYGDGKMLHAPKTGKSIEVIPIEGTFYEKELCAARRFWHETEESS
ncbi:NlpC/P60 family protein [Pontibacillus salicampi]|uniref:NlpC/P60 family protein n=1 Tax=Pontibacillus salicampi TaxID=1449801 RepID=A0ABV6LSH5_9BACI